MRIQKVSISIPTALYDFIENYQTTHHLKSRSDVINTALRLLQQQQLEACYLEANKELNHDFDHVAEDGLDDEAW